MNRVSLSIPKAESKAWWQQERSKAMFKECLFGGKDM